MRLRDGYGVLARVYFILETISLGNRLQKARMAFLPELLNCRNLLIFGEGDGRFIQALLKANFTGQITLVEKSAGMVQLLRRRLKKQNLALQPPSRIEIADVRDWEPPSGENLYDGVVTHFFWDQFREPSQQQIAQQLDSWLTKEALWLCADFLDPYQEGNRGIRARVQHGILRSWYLFFQWFGAIEAGRLHSHRALLKQLGWRCETCQSWAGNWIVSDLWRKNAFPHRKNEVNCIRQPH